MKMAKKVLAAGAALTMLGAVPGVANATGYIRIGDKCYIQMGVLVEIPCPREVSENP